MKKYILLFLLLAPCSLHLLQAQNYVVTSLATPGAAAFTSDMIKDGVITLPFNATSHSIKIETNQQNVTVASNADWCEASYAAGTLTLTVTENTSEDARTATLSVRSKDFHPLLITVKQEARLVFAVISDVHVGNTCGVGYKVKIPQALQHITARGKLDAMAVVGDLTDGGTASQYKEFVQFFGSEQNILNPIDKYLFMMGNHDNFPKDSQNQPIGQQNYQNGLKAFNGGKSYPLDQYVLIKGYPFIAISCRSGANNDDNTGNGEASYPTTVVNTLKRYLKQAAEDAPGKPIFVFTHVAPRNTCYSTWGDLEGAAWAMWRLNNTLNEYPQAIVFCGHSHYPLGDPRSIHQGANPNSKNMNYYTVVNTASTTYSEINPGAVDAGIHPEGFTHVTEGLIVAERSDGNIEIRRYDTYRDLEIDHDHPWVIKAPFNGSQFQYADVRDKDDNPNNVPLRTGLPAPAFYKSAELKLDIYPTDVTVSFPQATDNECVFRYNIRLLKDGNEVKSTFIFSQFYLMKDMPHTLSYTFEGLEKETKYTAEVTAYDSYDNASYPLTATFTTPSVDAPLPDPIGYWTFDNPDDLLAGKGVATLQGATHEKGNVHPVDNLADAAITAADGPTDDNKAISVPINSSLLMSTNINTNTLSTYTFLMDIHLAETSSYTSLFQNDLTNSKDGSLFVNNGTIGKTASGLGYNGMISSTGWHRIVFAVRNNNAKLYLDGNMIGQSTSANEANWQLSTGALFFGDENGEEHLVEVAELRFWDKMLTSGQVAELGGVSGYVVPEIAIPDATGAWTFDNPDNLMEGTGLSKLQPAKHSKGSVSVSTIAGAGIKTVDGPSGSGGAIYVPKGSSLKMTTNLTASSLSTFSFMMDIKLDAIGSYMPFFQNDPTNSRDAGLFIGKDGTIGIRRANLGYSAAKITAGRWHRVVIVSKNAKMTVYLDGTKIVGESPDADTERWKLGKSVLFFADEDGEETNIETAEIRFWDVALDTAQAFKLGAAGN